MFVLVYFVLCARLHLLLMLNFTYVMYLHLSIFLTVWNCTHVKADDINARVTSMLFVISSMFFSAFCLVWPLSVWSPVIWATHKLDNSHHVKGLMYN